MYWLTDFKLTIGCVPRKNSGAHKIKLSRYYRCMGVIHCLLDPCKLANSNSYIQVNKAVVDKCNAVECSTPLNIKSSHLDTCKMHMIEVAFPAKTAMPIYHKRTFQFPFSENCQYISVTNTFYGILHACKTIYA